MADLTVTYAIGDIHGEAERLRHLHGLIFKRHAFSFASRPIRIVHLGDFVDRGPDSCDVIDAIIELEQREISEVVNVRGNHEQMMLDAISGKKTSAMEFWLKNGGEETLDSYLRRGLEGPTQEHITWLEALPTLFADVANKIAYVHAGVDVETFPHCSEDVRMWTRARRFYEPHQWTNPELDGWRVVHGHTPTEDSFPEVAGEEARRINLDTGAVFGGRLTAGILALDEPLTFIFA